MTDKELICRALMGSREAQQECTEKRIALPCPFCGASGDDINLDYNSDISQFWIHCWKCHADGPIANYNANDAFAFWNTRPAPPVGRCKDCVWSREPTKNDYKEISSDLLFYEDSFVCDFCEDARWKDDFCSYFKKREEKNNENN